MNHRFCSTFGRCARLSGAVFSLASLLSGPYATATELGPYTGRWALRQTTTTVAEVPVIGKVYATTTAISLHKLKHKGEQLKGKGRLCKLDLDSGSSLVKTVMPEALLNALPPPRLGGILREQDGALRFTQQRQIIVLGAKLDDPAGGLLPRGLGDSRIVDQDGDGHPGVTVRVSGIVSGEIRVVQRSWTELVSTSVSPNRIDGAVRFGNEQVILDATSSMLKSPPPASPDWSRSTFRLVRLSDGAKCGDAIAALSGGT
jgi:hypothetical protein